MGRLEGRCAVVTDAGNGIGQSVVIPVDGGLIMNATGRAYSTPEESGK